MTELSTLKKLKKNLLKILENSNDVYIVGHNAPDLDSISSSIGLAEFCKNFTNSVYVIIDEEKAELEPGVKSAKKIFQDKFNIISIDKLAPSFIDPNSALIIVDTSKLNMTPLKNFFNNFKHFMIIDHHQEDDNTFKTKYKFIDSSVSSTSELVAQLLNSTKMNYDPNIATYLLAGIILDTKRYIKNTTPKTLETARQLLLKGANCHSINELFLVDFEQDRKINDLIFNGTIFKYYNYPNCTPKKIAYTFNIYDESIFYKREELARASDKMLKYKIDAAFVIGKTERKYLSISARSKDNLNVGNIMSILGGGGTPQSAGCQFKDKSIAEVFSLLEETVKSYLSEQSNLSDNSSFSKKHTYIKKIKKCQ